MAHVYDGVENDKTASWQNGERCIYLPVQKPGVNVVETVERIKALLPTIREQLPASVTLDVRSDRALTIREESAHDVKLTMMITVALVVLVIFIFLRNLSATVIPALHCRARWSGPSP